MGVSDEDSGWSARPYPRVAAGEYSRPSPYWYNDPKARPTSTKPYKPLMLEGVKVNSKRGFLTILWIIIGLVGGFLLLIMAPLFELGSWLTTGKPTRQFSTFSLTDIWLNLSILLVFPLYVFVYLWLANPRKAVVPLAYLSATPRAALHVMLGTAVGVASVLAYFAVAWSLVNAGLIEPRESEVIKNLVLLVRGHPELLLAIPIIAGFCEELLYRGFLQPRIGLGGSALLFGLAHVGYGTLIQIVVPFGLGLLYSYLFKKTGGLWAPMAAHASFDFTMLMLGYIRPQEAPVTSWTIGFL